MVSVEEVKECDSVGDESKVTREDEETKKELSPQGRLSKAVTDNDFGTVMVLLNDENLNAIDENGMTPLQHACFKGHLKMAELLLDRGAEVDSNGHEYRYTALMFAGLGGHVNCVSLLLEHGADPELRNSVGRNAAQMAGFVGQHRVVATINNFVPRSAVEYYAKINGLETEPKLPLRLVPAVTQLVRLTNVHPVRVYHFLQANSFLYGDLKRVATVLDLLAERFVRKDAEPKEMLSLKIHIIGFALRHLMKHLPSGEASQEAVQDALDKRCKFLLKVNESDFAENLERFLREAIRDYSYTENTIFQQLVRSLSTVEIGEEPTALTILQQVVVGKSEDGQPCATCAEPDAQQRCSACRTTNYCSALCQRRHWFLHKRHCTVRAKA